MNARAIAVILLIVLLVTALGVGGLSVLGGGDDAGATSGVQ